VFSVEMKSKYKLMFVREDSYKDVLSASLDREIFQGDSVLHCSASKVFAHQWYCQVIVGSRFIS
jgi:hypothetical protein